MPDSYVVKSALRASRLINAIPNRGFLSDAIPGPKSSFTRTITLSKTGFQRASPRVRKKSRSILMITREFTRGYHSGAWVTGWLVCARLWDRPLEFAISPTTLIISSLVFLLEYFSLARFRSGKTDERVYWSDEYPLLRRYLHSGDERGKKKRKKGVRVGAPFCRLCVFGL